MVIIIKLIPLLGGRTGSLESPSSAWVFSLLEPWIIKKPFYKNLQNLSQLDHSSPNTVACSGITVIWHRHCITRDKSTCVQHVLARWLAKRTSVVNQRASTCWTHVLLPRVIQFLCRITVFCVTVFWLQAALLHRSEMQLQDTGSRPEIGSIFLANIGYTSKY